MLTGDKNIDLFLKHVRSVTEKHEVKLLLQKKKKVKLNKNDYCSGYFNEYPTPKIVVAIDKPLEVWLPILVHEFCHLEQYLENDLTWEALDVYDTDSCSEFQNWLEGHDELHDELVTYHMRRIIEMEYNCEKRSVKKIKKFKLPIDTKDYIQKANAYMWFYSVVKQIRQWNGKDVNKSIFTMKELIDCCPNTWLKNPFNPPKKFVDILLKEYF